MLYNIERPHTFDSMVGQKEIVKNIRNQSIKNCFFQVYILEGQFGSGKTTMARIIALSANCHHKDENGNPCLECENCKAILNGNCADLTELDAASNTGVDAIRDLKETVNYVPLQLDKKVYIIDEVHMLSNGAFNALLKVLEEPPKNVIFILCTTEANKIPATVRSRAAKYQFQCISETDIVGHLKEVCKKHALNVEDKAISLIARNSHGAMRDALSLLEQVSKMENNVTEKHVIDMLGISDPTYLFAILEKMVMADVGAIITSVEALAEKGKNPFRMVSDMLDILASCVVASYRGANVVGNTQQECILIQKLVDMGNPSVFCSLIDGLMVIREELRSVPDRTTIVCGIIRMFSDEKGGFTILNARINELEKEIADMKQNGIAYVHSESTAAILDVPAEPPVEPLEGKTVSEEKMSESDTEKELETETDSKSEQVSAEENPSPTTEEEELSESAKEQIEDNSSNSSSEPETKEEDDEWDAFAFMDSFDFYNSESCGANEEPQAPTKEETISVSNTDTEEKGQEGQQENGRYLPPRDIDAYLEDLYDMQPTLESVFELNCTRTVESGHVVFTTENEDVFELISAFDETYCFPFEFRLENNK